MKNLLKILIITFSVSTMATVENDSTEKVTDSNSAPLGLELEVDGHVTRDELSEINGSSTVATLSSSYAIHGAHALNLNTELSYHNKKSDHDQSHLEYLEIGYSYDLEATKLNTTLTSSLYYQYTTNSVRKNEEEQEGIVYLLFESETSLSSSFSIEGELQTSKFLTTSDDEGVVKSDLYIEINPVYSVTDSLAVKMPISSTFYFAKGDQQDGYESTSIAPTLGYSFLENLELEAYAELTPFHSHDGKVVAPQYEKDVTYGLTLTYGMF